MIVNGYMYHHCGACTGLHHHTGEWAHPDCPACTTIHNH